MVTLPVGVLFDLGEANIRPEATPVLEHVALLFAQLPNHVRIEGHTDNIPISTSIYASNWELSIARAVNVLNYFLKNEKIQPERFSVAGYAETRPISSNHSEKNRAKNRRVELVILKEPENPL